jgi:hypothetical protein
VAFSLRLSARRARMNSCAALMHYAHIAALEIVATGSLSNNQQLSSLFYVVETAVSLVTKLGGFSFESVFKE